MPGFLVPLPSLSALGRVCRLRSLDTFVEQPPEPEALDPALREQRAVSL